MKLVTIWPYLLGHIPCLSFVLNEEAVIDLFQEDIELMVDMGLEAFRISISWSRLIPSMFHCINFYLLKVLKVWCCFHSSTDLMYTELTEGRGPVNAKGLLFYNNLINELLSHGEIFTSNQLVLYLEVAKGKIVTWDQDCSLDELADNPSYIFPNMHVLKVIQLCRNPTPCYIISHWSASSVRRWV